METEEANETDGQSSGQQGLHAQVVITLVSGIFISRKAALHSSNIFPIPDMTYNVFGGTLSLTQSINLLIYCIH